MYTTAERLKRTRGLIREVATHYGIAYKVRWMTGEGRKTQQKTFRDRAEAERFRESLPYITDRTRVARVTNRVTRDGSGCWVVSGSVASNGYPHVGFDWEKQSTHRVMFEEWYGPIPDGLEIDHICRNKRCCNPEHLEPVPPAENFLRGEHPTAVAVRTGRCYRGHELTEENTVWYRNGKRTCRQCRDDRMARYRLTA
jgi:hypothetical protein